MELTQKAWPFIKVTYRIFTENNFLVSVFSSWGQGSVALVILSALTVSLWGIADTFILSGILPSVITALSPYIFPIAVAVGLFFYGRSLYNTYKKSTKKTKKQMTRALRPLEQHQAKYNGLETSGYYSNLCALIEQYILKGYLRNKTYHGFKRNPQRLNSIYKLQVTMKLLDKDVTMDNSKREDILISAVKYHQALNKKEHSKGFWARWLHTKSEFVQACDKVLEEAKKNEYLNENEEEITDSSVYKTFVYECEPNEDEEEETQHGEDNKTAPCYVRLLYYQDLGTVLGEETFYEFRPTICNP